MRGLGVALVRHLVLDHWHLYDQFGMGVMGLCTSSGKIWSYVIALEQGFKRRNYVFIPESNHIRHCCVGISCHER
jgi:hypothetical protein